MKTEFRQLYVHFRSISRPLREQLLCAMIRVNYGTPWTDDMMILKNFFPNQYYNRFNQGGLTPIIESLSPFSDDPTQSGADIEHHTLVSSNDTDSFSTPDEDFIDELTADMPFEDLEPTVKVAV